MSFFFIISGAIQQKLNNLPVFFISICKTFFFEIFLFCYLKFNYWPPAIPRCPEHSEIFLIRLIFIELSNLSNLLVKISDDKVKSELPANTAVDSPNLI